MTPPYHPDTADPPGLDGADPWTQQRFSPSGFSTEAGFFTWLLPSGEVVCDEHTLRLHGLPPGTEPRIGAFLSRVPEEDLDALRHTVRSLTAAAGDYVIEYRVHGADGQLRTLEGHGRVVAGPAGTPTRSMGVVSDVTARRAAEKRARTEARSTARIQAVTAGLAAASTLSEVAAAVEAALPALGADSLIVADAGRHVEVLLSCGRYTVGPGTVPVARHGPLREAMARETALFFPSANDLCARFPEVTEAVKASGHEAWAFLPLAGLPRLRGICLFGFAHHQEFDEADRSVLVLAGSAIGQAVGRAAIRDTEYSMALALQEGMLPPTLRFGPAVSAARRYQAATTGIQVGGDWYDSVPLDDGSTVLIIGDVEGHNVHAAGVMYRLRTTVRAYAAEKHPVDEILRRANEFVAEINLEAEQPLFATCLVARVDPRTRTVTASRAGHIPPIVLPPGRAAQVPATEVGMPLGVDENAAYPVWDMPYEAGTLLLLCTDGLLESVDNDLDVGIARTLRALDGARERPIEELADLLLAANRPVGALKDDVALLLARLD